MFVLEKRTGFLMKQIVYVNIDGIIAEFESKMFHQIKTLIKDEHYEYRSALYELVPPIKGGIQAVESLLNMNEVEVNFISTPTWYDTEVWMEKREWLSQLFKSDKVTKRLFLCHQKHLLRGDYLIDHSWRYGSKHFQGEWIHVGVDPRFQGWDEVLLYLIAEAGNGK